MKISYVIPCYHSSKTLPGVIKEIKVNMQKMQNYEYEIVLVNDCSSDNTLDVIRTLCSENTNIIGISLAKNFGQHAALMAGYRNSSGDIVVSLDDDGQTPADEADRLIIKLEEGYDVVYAEYENKRHSFFRNIGSRMNSAMTVTMLDKPKDLYISSYFAARRFVIDEIVKYENPYPYVTGLVLRTTKNICNVKVTHKARVNGQSGYSFRKLVHLWVNGFTSFSVKPLRFASVSGVMTAVAGFVYAVWTIIKKFVYPMAPVGWSSTVAIILILGGMILFVLGMIGEYVGRIYICMNKSPQYVVKEQMNERSSKRTDYE